MLLKITSLALLVLVVVEAGVIQKPEFKDVISNKGTCGGGKVQENEIFTLKNIFRMFL